jgi:hypothetical protein
MRVPSQIEPQRPFAESVAIRSEGCDRDKHDRPSDPFHADLLKMKKAALLIRGSGWRGADNKKAGLYGRLFRAVMQMVLLRPMAGARTAGDDDGGDKKRHHGDPFFRPRRVVKRALIVNRHHPFRR